MKKTLIIFLSILINTIYLFSSDFPFNIERLNIDFKGVVANDNVIICYGEFGIISYSEDRGETWKKHALGDSNCIQKIIYHEGVFYGVSEFAFIKSTDNGKSWQLKKIYNEPLIRDLTIYENHIYLLTIINISKYNLDLNLHHLPNPFDILLENDNLSDQIIENSGNLYLNSRFGIGKIIKIDIKTLTVEKIDFSKAIDCIYCEKPTLFFDEDNNLFIKTNIYLLKYSGFNKWEILHNYVLGDITLIDNLAYELSIYRTELTVNWNTNYEKQRNHLPKFVKINNIYDKEVLSDSIHRYLMPSECIINKTIKFNGDTLIAVGTNHTILFSFDFGKSWHTKSYYDNKDLNTNTFVKDSLLVIFDNFYIQTTNNGATWNPRVYKQDEYVFFGGQDSYIDGYYAMDESGKGCFIQYYKSNISQKIYRTNNYGKTFIYDSITIFMTSRLYASKKITKVMNNYISAIARESSADRSTNIFLFNENFEPINQYKIDSVGLSNIVVHDNIIYSIGTMKKSPYINSEKKQDWKEKYLLLCKSTDMGYSWDTTRISNFVNSSDLLYNLKYNNYKLYWFVEISATTQKLYIYDLNENKLDSNLLGFNRYEFYDEKVYFSPYYDYNSIGVRNSELQIPSIDDTVYLRDILYNYKSYNTNIASLGDYRNIEIKKEGDKYLLFIGRSDKISSMGGLQKNYQTYIIELTPKSHTSVENEIEIPTQMYVKKPFPLPAQSIVNTEVYWDLRHDIDVADIGIYNSMGSRVGGRENININKTAEYKGIVSWDCSGMPAGVYFIQIRHGDAVKSIPVVVGK